MYNELKNIRIPIENLLLMPSGKILGAYSIEDVYDRSGVMKTEALKIRWTEYAYSHPETRTAYFRLDNGEYSGEATT